MLPFSIVLEALARIIRQKKKKVKGIQIGKEQTKWLLSVDGLFLHMETIKAYIQKELPGFANTIQLPGARQLIKEVSSQQQ